MRCLSLFSGIGGIDLAAQAVGFEVVAFCESDPFCRAVLSTHWPHIPIYHEVKEVSYARLQRDGRLPIDLVFGGPPCQPASLAGKRRGARDERWLWPELLRVVGELRPRWCVAENPLGILSIDAGRAWGEILGTLVALGYRCGWGVWGAAEVGAPHRRERVFLLGYRAEGAVADSGGPGQWFGTPQPQRQSRRDATPDAGLDGAESAVADPADQGRAGRERARGKTALQAVSLDDARGGCQPVAHAACREDRGDGECGLQPDAAPGATAVADAEGEHCQWRGPAWAGQSRSANGADVVADAASAGLEKRAGVARNAPAQCTPAGRAAHAGRGNDGGGVEVPQCRLGGVLDGLSAWLEHPIFPAGPTVPQAVWEPPRMIPRGRGGDPYRRKRLHALGNAVVPAQILPLFRAIAIAEAEAEAEQQRVGWGRDEERT